MNLRYELKKVNGEYKMAQNSVSRTTLWGCVLGHGLEMYDFTLYGAFTTLIALHFFDQNSSESSFIFALLALSAGYIARPMGAVLFGYIGDIYGRKRSLILTILIASIATGTIGLCPSYISLGVLSSVILFIARFLQGFCAGAETSDASVYLIESSPKEKSSFGSSMIFLSGGIGCLIALFTSKLFLTFESDVAWRYPFLIGCFFGVFVLYLRFQSDESREFSQQNNNTANLSIVFKKLIFKHTSGLGKSISCGFLSGVTSTTIVVFVNLYLHKLKGFEMSSALTFSLYGLIPFIMSCFFCSRITSRETRNKVITLAMASLFILGGPYFYAVATGVVEAIIIAQVALGLCAGAFIAPVNSLLAEQFPPDVRCTGVSVGYNIGYAFTSGIYPILAFKLIDYTGNIYSPCVFILFFSGLALCAVLGPWRTSIRAQTDLNTTLPA